MRATITGENLIFAGGAPRSGLTLLRALADGHPNIFCGPDSGLLPSLPMQWRTIAFNLGELHRKDFDIDPAATQNNFAAAIARLLTKPLQQFGKKRLLEKNPLNILAFQELAALFPRAKFVHVVRDGRDVAASLLARDWRDPQTGARFAHTSEAGAAARYWRGLVEIGRAAERAVGDPSRFFVLRYERLVEGPEDALRALFEFVEEPFDAGVLDFHRRPIRLYGIERDSGPLLQQPLSGARVGRWRTELTKSQVDEVESVASDTLRSLRYL